MDNAEINAKARQMKNMNIAQVIAEGGSSNVGSVLSPVESAIARANSLAQANSARSAAEARELREWQEQQNAKAMAFNASEAAKSRDWQEYMSNTAHQREIADLKAAGLNPVLSAMGGNGAAVTSGATASGVTSAGAKGEVDTSANQAITNLLGSMIGYMSNLAATSISAQASMANAEKAAEVNKFVGQLNAWATQYSADQHRAGTEYSADQHRAGTEYAADRTKFGILDALIDFLGSGDDNGSKPDGSVLYSPEYNAKFGNPGTIERFLLNPLALFNLLVKKG